MQLLHHNFYVSKSIAHSHKSAVFWVQQKEHICAPDSTVALLVREKCTFQEHSERPMIYCHIALHRFFEDVLNPKMNENDP